MCKHCEESNHTGLWWLLVICTAAVIALMFYCQCGPA